MLRWYRPIDGALHSEQGSGAVDFGVDAVWIDMLEPTAADEAAVESHLGIGVPTREEMREIEDSSRLYRDGDAAYMTAVAVSGSQTANPKAAAISFVLTRAHLVTVRYTDPHYFRHFAQHCHGFDGQPPASQQVMIGLLETMVDRLSWVLRQIDAELDAIGDEIFAVPPEAPDGPFPHAAVTAPASPNTEQLKTIIQRLGRHNKLLRKVGESLTSLDQLIPFFEQTAGTWSADMPARLHVLARDVLSLRTHANQMNGELTFLLDSTLGLISIQQNTIIKVLSVATVLALPPTLIGTVYGMNFQMMPELNWSFGYPLALASMLLSAGCSYLFLRHKGWM